MKKALYRKRICAEKEKLTPEKVFHTPQYRDLFAISSSVRASFG